MFGHRFWGAAMFGPRFFGPAQAGGGTSIFKWLAGCRRLGLGR